MRGCRIYAAREPYIRNEHDVNGMAILVQGGMAVSSASIGRPGRVAAPRSFISGHPKALSSLTCAQQTGNPSLPNDSLNARSYYNWPTPASACTTACTPFSGVSVYAYGTLVKVPFRVRLISPLPQSLSVKAFVSYRPDPVPMPSYLRRGLRTHQVLSRPRGPLASRPG